MADQITINKSKLVSSLIYVALISLSVGTFYVGRSTAEPKTLQASNDSTSTTKLQEAYLAGCRAAVIPANAEDFNGDKYKTDTDVCFSDSKNYGLR